MGKVTIIAIPFAGGNEYSYERFKQFLPANFELKTVGLPGRGERSDEEMLSDLIYLARDIYTQIKSDIQQKEYLIYGHSLGTLLGYELTKEIIKNGCPKPSLLFFTGRNGPSFADDKHISSYPKEEFWREVIEMGGIPEEVLGNIELLDFFEPVLRSDIKAVESYIYEPMIRPFDIPIFVLAGTEEFDITKESLESWQKESRDPIHAEFMTGDHFFIFTNPSKIISRIVKAYKSIN